MMVDIFGKLCFTDDGLKSWVTSDDGDTDDNMSSIVKLKADMITLCIIVIVYY